MKRRKGTALELEDKIGYQFKNKNLLLQALTHSSYANEGKKHGRNNERLEFLGDSVLSVIVAKHLFLKYKDIPEGELTKLRASLVCEKALDVFAQKLGLGEYLRLGKGEEMTGGRSRPSILADAFEAVIAALYLDGGYQAAQKFVLSFIPENLDVKSANQLADYKTTLQEIIQQNREEKIEYVLADEKGPDHAKVFTAEVLLNSNVIGVGEGSSKKQAEQNAAREALKLMGYDF
ncbi:ribonuclease III [Clostridiaceae bacterium NSJ-33]|uniref:Ribonuclease 3 n=1 Tax=Fumia xinanensis TaxID=2763659 RepID=A0A926E2I8_9FIRM|nr:ribonuclease III [Fumia xinanensis]